MRSSALPGTLLAALLTLLAPSASAEILLEAFMGKAFNQPSDLAIHQPRRSTDLTFRNVSFEDKSFKPSPYYGYRLAYFFDSQPWLGLTIEFLHLKAFAENERIARVQGLRNGARLDAELPMSQVVQAYAVTHGLNFLTLNLQARRRMLSSPKFPEGRVSPYAGFGLGPVIPYSESVVEGRDHDTGYFVSRRPGFQAFAGGRLQIHRRWLIFTEYKFTHADLRTGIDSGSASARFRAHHLLFGLGFVLKPFSPP